jgi:hypothetical protein
MAEPQSIGLAELIQEVKRELVTTDTSTGDGNPGAPLFMVEDIELEIKVGVTAKGGGGVDIHVVQLNAGIQRDDVHTVTVKLQPILSHDERLALLRRDGLGPEIERQAKALVKGDGPSRND